MITFAIARDRDEVSQLSRWVAEHIWPGKGKDFGNCQGMGVIEDEKLIAGAIWHNYESDAGVIEISAASTSKRWLTGKVLAVLFGVPFREWGCQAVVLRVSDDDVSMHNIAKRYGFVHYKIPRLRGKEAGENVFVLTDDAWRDNKFQQREARKSKAGV